MTITEFLHHATQTFAGADIPTARLDVLVLMEQVLKHNKAWLLAHGEEPIVAEKLADLQQKIARRAKREPLAYILGQQEFYGRRFSVTPDVLVPRPESELLIDLLKTLPLPNGASLLDIGTGSGTLAITAARELPHLRVDACDTSPAALAVAAQNAERLGALVHFFESDLLHSAEKHYTAIIANLPYVARDWQRSPETNFEPPQALFAKDDGLALITQLIASAPEYLHQGGWLLLEADPRQFARIKELAEPAFTLIRSEGFAQVLQKN